MSAERRGARASSPQRPASCRTHGAQRLGSCATTVKATSLDVSGRMPATAGKMPALPGAPRSSLLLRIVSFILKVGMSTKGAQRSQPRAKRGTSDALGFERYKTGKAPTGRNNGALASVTGTNFRPEGITFSRSGLIFCGRGITLRGTGTFPRSPGRIFRYP